MFKTNDSLKPYNRMMKNIQLRKAANPYSSNSEYTSKGHRRANTEGNKSMSSTNDRYNMNEYIEEVPKTPLVDIYSHYKRLIKPKNPPKKAKANASVDNIHVKIKNKSPLGKAVIPDLLNNEFRNIKALKSQKYITTNPHKLGVSSHVLNKE
jgi:hypothetical protein